MSRYVLLLGLAFLLPSCSDLHPVDLSVSDPSFSRQGPKDGKSAYALEFSGAQWMYTPYVADLNLGSTWTLEAWIKPSLLVERQDLISRWASGTMASFNFNLKYATVNLSTRQEPNNTPAQTGSILTVGEWQHVAVAFDNGLVRIYLNGQLQLEIADRYVPQDNSQILSLGREAGYDGFYYRGQIDDVRVWSVVRTGTEIQSSMKNVKRKDRADLIAWWPMDEGTGDIAYDAAGSHDMQLGNAAGSDSGDPTWVKEPKKR